MVKIYLRRIRAGLMRIEDVPERWREAVRAELQPEPIWIDDKPTSGLLEDWP